MKNSITHIGTELINNLIAYFSASGDILTIAQMEHDLAPLIREAVGRLATQYIEDVDARLRSDKAGRREAGYSVERHCDARRVLSEIGELSFGRTYYSHRDGGHAYLVDMAIGLERYDRISDGVSVALAGAACEMSYAKSSAYTVGGAVSRQTVMNQVRGCGAAATQEAQEKRLVPVLHIDADEDHVTMRGGRKGIVPLISVYEGVEQKGSRGRCINVFHISEYGKTPDDLWEQALSEVEARYDLANTKIYIHGDGASWIQQGLEWFPCATFVLDKYHKNKAITAMTAGLDKDDRKTYSGWIRAALSGGDSCLLAGLAESLASQLPEREEIISEAAGYLINNIEAISVCGIDHEANNGGCTEPHVSHILSCRLSNLPLTWSAKTLKQLAPMLANGGVVELQRQQSTHPADRILRKAARGARRAIKKMYFEPDPDSIGALIPISNGKVNQLYRTLRSLSRVNSF